MPLSLHPALPPPPCGPHRAQGGPLRTGSDPASWVVLRAPSCRPSHKPKAERSGQLGRLDLPGLSVQEGTSAPRFQGWGGVGEARSPETWMVYCLSSPGLPARVPSPPSPPSPRVKPILPNPKGRQTGLCFSEPNMLRWTDRHPVTDHLRGVRLSVQGCHVPASHTKPPATHWHGEALSNQPVVTSRTHGKQRGPGIRPRALRLGHPVSWEQEAFES